jgi:hypothetical protein
MKKFNKIEMTTLVKCTNNLTVAGYTENFVASEKGIVAPSKGEKLYTPDQVRINSFYRFEGESDPADNCILYALETAEGLKGMLVDAYGAYANPHVGKFIGEVQAIEKSAHRHDPNEGFINRLKQIFSFKWVLYLVRKFSNVWTRMSARRHARKLHHA